MFTEGENVWTEAVVGLTAPWWCAINVRMYRTETALISWSVYEKAVNPEDRLFHFYFH